MNIQDTHKPVHFQLRQRTTKAYTALLAGTIILCLLFSAMYSISKKMNEAQHEKTQAAAQAL